MARKTKSGKQKRKRGKLKREKERGIQWLYRFEEPGMNDTGPLMVICCLRGACGRSSNSCGTSLVMVLVAQTIGVQFGNFFPVPYWLTFLNTYILIYIIREVAPVSITTTTPPDLGTFSTVEAQKQRRAVPRTLTGENLTAPSKSRIKKNTDAKLC